ncbi:S-layer homology domain-containing protein [Saccharibacillus sp. CPCC 101409]|uniref:S-layer homology domain-containing protein n=1 Tax=Saccharibacillus sp. CPCC 101409 TaxID=3058041 RepID=UPI002671A2F1|nr:S-layer homology domain-containing protein [Saccharibacillus sp. CPCC 101409]MDO3409880.1 S-layer homology domain-containing protein [Saccharibacillus sp. CPCC 101409]
MSKSYGKVLGMMLAAALTVSGIGEASPSAYAAKSDFSDIKPAHWAAGAIQKAVDKGYVNGYTNGTFKPDASVSRAEFVKMVVSALNLDAPAASGKWYVPYVDAATQAGLYAGADFSNNDAGWNKVMTRDEMARVAARAIGEKTGESDKWMYLATKSGLIQGVGKAQLAPEGLTTRAQAVVIIERILKANAGDKLAADRYAVGAAEILWHGTNIFTVMPEKFVTPESDWKSEGKSSIEEMWNEKKMVFTSKDGQYQGKLDALVAIDLADPNDPNRGLLGNIDTLKWYNNGASTKDLFVKDNKNSYVLYFKGQPAFNKNPDKYGAQKELQFNLQGFHNTDMQSFFAGKLNQTARIYRNRSLPSDIPAVIIPKTGTMQNGHNIEIVLQVPIGGSEFKESELLSLRGIQ